MSVGGQFSGIVGDRERRRRSACDRNAGLGGAHECCLRLRCPKIPSHSLERILVKADDVARYIEQPECDVSRVSGQVQESPAISYLFMIIDRGYG